LKSEKRQGTGDDENEIWNFRSRLEVQGPADLIFEAEYAFDDKLS
jgi:hypothetical protein